MAAIIDVVRDALRRTSIALDETELKPLIEAAKMDLFGSGVGIVDDADPLIQSAIRLFVLAMIEKDERQWQFYQTIKNHIALDSTYNGDFHA